MNRRAFIYLIRNNVIIVEKGTAAKAHHHHAIQIAISLKTDASIRFNGSVVKGNTIIYDADKMHTFDALSNWIIVLLINPDTELGNHIRQKFLSSKDVFFTDIDYGSHIPDHFDEMISEPLFRNDMVHIHDEIILHICGRPTQSFQLDERIKKVLQEIDQLEEKKIPVKELAAKGYLSESRFMHLFKEEIRIPVRQFLLWLRLLDAVRLLIRGESLTEAAMISGFTDLPHLHKTFTHFFGVKISDYFKNSRFIQVRDYTDA